MKNCLHLVLLFVFLLANPTSYAQTFDEETLNKQLKGKPLSEVVKVLGNPTVKKPCEECETEGGYWWYKLEEGISILVPYREGKVIDIRVITKEERSKEI